MTSSTTAMCSPCTSHRARNGTTWCCSTRVWRPRTPARAGSTPASRGRRSGSAWWCEILRANRIRHSGMVGRTRPQMRNCASGNLEIPGSMLSHRPGMTPLASFPRDEIKIFPSRRRAIRKRLLLVLGRGPDVVANDVEQLSHLDARLPDVARQRCRERAVGALAVERGLAVLGRIHHHEAGRRLDGGKPLVGELTRQG